jgi:hypothetical protein
MLCASTQQQWVWNQVRRHQVMGHVDDAQHIIRIISCQLISRTARSGVGVGVWVRAPVTLSNPRCFITSKSRIILSPCYLSFLASTPWCLPLIITHPSMTSLSPLRAQTHCSHSLACSCSTGTSALWASLAPLLCCNRYTVLESCLR